MSFWRWSSNCYRVHFKEKIIFKTSHVWANSTYQSKNANPIAVARKRRGSGHWFMSVHSWNIQGLQWCTCHLYRTLGSPTSPEDKCFLLMLILSLPSCLFFPSIPTSAACSREIIRGGTKVFLSHCGLKTIHTCLNMLGDTQEQKDSSFFLFCLFF